ncbi:MAG TPA: flagellar hook capping FlgD N-terminal domain-containing protein [Verrucomicrobiae bacterium]|jgi:flagellar basal-body rod modification protein FlgD
MAVAAINPVAATPVDAQANDALSRLPTQTLNQDDFLKLVVAQMTSQDPLNPQKDTEFIAQMAQFTSLEQTKTMSSNLAQMRSQQEFLQASATLGRNVTLQDRNGNVTTGVVTAIDVNAGTPQIVVNGQPHDMTDVVSIEAASGRYAVNKQKL